MSSTRGPVGWMGQSAPSGPSPAPVGWQGLVPRETGDVEEAPVGTLVDAGVTPADESSDERFGDDAPADDVVPAPAPEDVAVSRGTPVPEGDAVSRGTTQDAPGATTPDAQERSEEELRTDEPAESPGDPVDAPSSGAPVEEDGPAIPVVDDAAAAPEGAVVVEAGPAADAPRADPRPAREAEPVVDEPVVDEPVVDEPLVGDLGSGRPGEPDAPIPVVVAEEPSEGDGGARTVDGLAPVDTTPTDDELEAAEQAQALAAVVRSAAAVVKAPRVQEPEVEPVAPPQRTSTPAVEPAERFPRPEETRILTIANQKGGVDKTTTAVNLAAALAAAGLKVLVLDVDPQGNASTALGIEHHEEVPGIYEVLVEGRPLAEVVQRCAEPGDLWCAPATIDLAGAEIELVSMVARESRLQRALTTYLRQVERSGAGRIDYVLIDCPPSLGLLTINAFVAAPEVLIPIQCEYYALEGLTQLLSNIDLIRQHLNPDLHVSTILLTMYDGRTRLAAQVVEEVRSHFGEQVLSALVPRSVRISEAPSHGKSVMAYDPTSSGALAYLEAARELASRAVLLPEDAPGVAAGSGGGSRAEVSAAGRSAPDPWSRWAEGTAGRRGASGRGEGSA